MKNLFNLFLIVCCFLFSLTALAQKPKVGIRVGSNYTNFIGKDAKELNLQNIWGGHGGLNITLPVYKNNISLKSDIIYSTKGAASANDSLKINLGYLDVPLLGQITAGPFYLEAGPQMSFLIKDTFKDKSGKTNAETMLNSFRRTSVCFAVGAGTYIPVLGLTLGIRYNGDFSNLVNNLDDKNFRNSLFLFTTSFTLPTKSF